MERLRPVLLLLLLLQALSLNLSFSFVMVAAQRRVPARARARAPVPAAFVFGDSLSEVGNNNYLPYALAKANFPWYGIDYRGGVATGRFTNGRTIGDMVTVSLGLKSPPPYLSVSPTDASTLRGGVNYASGGGGILNSTGFLFVQRLSMDSQISLFQSTKDVISRRFGSSAAEAICNDAVFFVSIGSNDYINNFLLPFSSAAKTYTVNAFNRLLITTFQQQLTRLYTLGARKILLNGVGPLGCIPSQRHNVWSSSNSNSNSNSRVSVEQLNRWVQQLNSGMQALVRRLNARLRGVSISYVDTYSIVKALVEQPRAFGFKVADRPCCQVNSNSSSSNIISTLAGDLCLPNSNLCSDRGSYVFWDAFHPTEAANRVIAKHILSHLSSPSPSPSPSPPPSDAND